MLQRTCVAEKMLIKFELTKKQFAQEQRRWHIIDSIFVPEEVSFEEAHQVELNFAKF